MIRVAEPTDIPKIIEIHRSSLKEDYLPQLGRKVIFAYYEMFIKKNPIFVFEKNYQIIGFLALCHTSVNLIEIFFKYPWKILKKILLKRRLWLQTLWITLFSRSSNNRPEISFIAVEKSHRALGVGSQLISFCCDFLRKNGKKHLIVKTDKHNIPTNTFYRNHGFHIVATENRFNRWLNVYLKELDK